MERTKKSQRLFSRINATKNEFLPKIRLVLWLADRMFRLLFDVLAMLCFIFGKQRVIPLNFMVRGTPVLFRFFSFVNGFRLRELRSLSKTVLNGIDMKPSM